MWVGVKWNNWAPQSVYLHVESEGFITVVSLSEIALSGHHLLQPLVSPNKATAYFDYHKSSEGTSLSQSERFL